MLHTTSGIIIHTTKYSDTSLIAKIYTRKFGLQSYMINGVRSKKSNKKAQLFQPLALVDLVVTNSHKQKLERVSEISPLHPYSNIPFDILKSSLVIFLNEILYKSLKEEHADEDIFDFIKNSLLVLDLMDENCANFHLLFMIKLSRYLGFYPEGKYMDEATLFDLEAGKFVNALPIHPYYLSAKLSKLLYAILQSGYENTADLKINNADRKELLKAMVLFYQLHISSFKEIKSQAVLEEIIAE